MVNSKMDLKDPPLNGSIGDDKCNSPPTADRYAALKDLDEQLRESKSVATSINAAVHESAFVGLSSKSSFYLFFAHYLIKMNLI